MKRYSIIYCFARDSGSIHYQTFETKGWKVYLSDLIEAFIMQERKQVKKISQNIQVPLIIHEMTFDNTDVDIIFTKLKEVYGESFIRYEHNNS